MLLPSGVYRAQIARSGPVVTARGGSAMRAGSPS